VNWRTWTEEYGSGCDGTYREYRLSESDFISLLDESEGGQMSDELERGSKTLLEVQQEGMNIVC